MKLLTFTHTAYRKFASAASLLQSPLLLAIRVYWGWQFYQAGWGKLSALLGWAGPDAGNPAEFFASLGIPFPTLNAYVASSVETIGGFFLLAGLASRATALALSFTMIVAYSTAHKEVLPVIWSDPDKFTAAAPFPFLYTALIVLAFGPGLFSVDWLLGKIFRKKVEEPNPIDI
jgi:putative oxidoreductase